MSAIVKYLVAFSSLTLVDEKDSVIMMDAIKTAAKQNISMRASVARRTKDDLIIGPPIYKRFLKNSIFENDSRIVNIKIAFVFQNFISIAKARCSVLQIVSIACNNISVA